MTIVTTIARGDASRVSEPRRVVARTDEEWRTLWAVHAGPGADTPAADMTMVTVAAAFAGDKPSAGYALEISAADEDGGGITLVVEEHEPEPGMVSAQVMTSPFHIVAVPKTADITWAEAGGARREARERRDPNAAPPASHLAPRTSPPSSTGLDPRTASALAYLAGPFSGALILFAESTNDTVRFHAWQSIVALGGLGLAVLASFLLALLAFFVSATAVTVMVVVGFVIWSLLAVVWAVCLWKALSGRRWKLPLAGDYAERFV